MERNTSSTRRRPSIALLVALAALAASLTTNAWAALTITGANVRNGTLTGADVRNASLTGLDVRNGTIRGVDLAGNSIPASRLTPAARESLRGATGPQGIQGIQGPAGSFSSVVVRTRSAVVSNGSTGGSYAACEDGERVVGGGGDTLSTLVTLVHSYPAKDVLGTAVNNGEQATGWVARLRNDSGVAAEIRTYVLCAT